MRTTAEQEGSYEVQQEKSLDQLLAVFADRMRQYDAEKQWVSGLEQEAAEHHEKLDAEASFVLTDKQLEELGPAALKLYIVNKKSLKLVKHGLILI